MIHSEQGSAEIQKITSLYLAAYSNTYISALK